MTILNRTISIALGASIALAPVFAFADDGQDATNTEDRAPFMHTLLNRIEAVREPQMRAEMHGDASTSMRVEYRDATTTRPVLAHLEDRADTHIDNRIEVLQKISDRIEGNDKIPEGVKTSLSATFAAQIKELADLKEKIGSDTSTTSMRDDAGKIRPEFRTYALVLPQAAITAGSNRVLAIATQMDAVGTKLNTRITEAAASSTVNVSSAQTAYTDYLAKVADAKVQAQAAAALVVNLKPDNGDKTIFDSNSTALKDASAKLKAAQTDLKAARADINVILKVIRGTGVQASASTTAETN